MFEVVKKSLEVSDYILLILWAFVLSHMDFSNLSTFDKISLVVLSMWFIMLLIRIYIVYKNGGGKDE